MDVKYFWWQEEGLREKYYNNVGSSSSTTQGMNDFNLKITQHRMSPKYVSWDGERFIENRIF
jgi:hypothetical protein